MFIKIGRETGDPVDEEWLDMTSGGMSQISNPGDNSRGGTKLGTVESQWRLEAIIGSYVSNVFCQAVSSRSSSSSMSKSKTFLPVILR